jgi:GH43 family beta-xylosidase
LVTVAQAQSETTFTNPLLPAGADPWCIYKNGYYYYTHTTVKISLFGKQKQLLN